MSKYHIYGLYDPSTGELRYIGKTKMTLARRLWHHIKYAKTSPKNLHKLNWIRKVLESGNEPIIAPIKETSEEDWRKDEMDCISYALRHGANLTNLTAGGDGLVGYHHSKETKKRISEHNIANGKIPPSRKGRKQLPDHIRKRVKTRQQNGNYNHSQETKDLISQKNTGKNLGNTHTLGMKHTDEWKEEMSERNSGEGNPFYGRQHTKESKKKISRSKKGIKATKETKVKLSEAHQIRVHREQLEHIAKIAIPHNELFTLSDDPQVNEVRRLYVEERMTRMEIMRYFGYKGSGGRFYRKISKAINEIPVKDDVECLCSTVDTCPNYHENWCPKSGGDKC